MNLEFLN